MPKFTIYVPDDLKAEMDQADGQDPKPNWSAVAQEAFRNECQRLSNRKRSKGKMNAVIERLRASKEKQGNQDRVSGHAAGRLWASDQAEYDELKRAAAFAHGLHDMPQGELHWPAPYSGAGWFYSKISDDERPDNQEVAEFWEGWAKTESPSDDFVFGFAEGAAEVLDEVDHKL